MRWLRFSLHPLLESGVGVDDVPLLLRRFDHCLGASLRTCVKRKSIALKKRTSHPHR